MSTIIFPIAISVATQVALDLKAPIASPTFTGTVSGVTKAMVGLGLVDNTSDASKPVSTATQIALDLKAPIASPVFTGTIRTSGYTVATLPVGVVGDRAYVTDATVPTYNAALVGGGTVVVGVFRNATVWVSA